MTIGMIDFSCESLCTGMAPLLSYCRRYTKNGGEQWSQQAVQKAWPGLVAVLLTGRTTQAQGSSGLGCVV
jgi:hypothetical protein